jgi:hypothetical protein
MQSPAPDAPDIEWKWLGQLRDIPWLPLDEVLLFVQNGWTVWPTTAVLVEKFQEIAANPDGDFRRSGSLAAGLGGFATAFPSIPALKTFSGRLTDAGLSGQVRFYAVKRDDPDTEGAELHPAYFERHSDFGPIPFRMSGGTPTISRRSSSDRGIQHWKNVTVERVGFLKWLRAFYPEIAALHDEFNKVAIGPQDAQADHNTFTKSGKAASAKHIPKRRGRREGYDWARIRDEAVRLMLHNGMWTGEDPDWNSQACLERAVASFCQTEFQREPAPSGIRKRVPDWLREFEQVKAV